MVKTKMSGKVLSWPYVIQIMKRIGRLVGSSNNIFSVDKTSLKSTV